MVEITVLFCTKR